MSSKAEKAFTSDVLKSLEVSFKAQRSLPKKEVMKLKPGTWLEMRFTDSCNSVVLLLERPEHRVGDVCLVCFDVHGSEAVERFVHSQVVRALGTVVVPTL